MIAPLPSWAEATLARGASVIPRRTVSTKAGKLALPGLALILCESGPAGAACCGSHRAGSLSG